MAKNQIENACQSDQEKKENFHSESYCNAMRYFGSAVHIVTTDGVAGKRGVTISACCSLSVFPPTVLVCLSHQVQSNEKFIENGIFCINTLAAQHKDLSNIFGGRAHVNREERFNHGSWIKGRTGAPVLEDALISLECKISTSYKQNTHYIILGEVVDIKQTKADMALIYLDRKYHFTPLENKD